MKKVPVIFIVSLVLILALSSLSLAESNSRDLDTMPNSTSGSSFLEEEAGITAYTQVDSMDLSEAKEAFKNIEREDDDYIVGSVSIADHRESNDVHVYVDTSGWIAAYYIKKEPASKIIDWRHYDPSSGADNTNLERGIISITDVLSVQVEIPYFKYCDFRHPDADKIMVVTDEVVDRKGTETFRIKIPSDFTVYSRSWSHYGKANYYCEWVKINIDEVTLHEFDPYQSQNGWKIFEGSISPSQLSLGTYHKISTSSDCGGTSSYAGIALVYSR